MRSLFFLMLIALVSFFVPIVAGDVWFAPVILLALAAVAIRIVGTVAGAVLYVGIALFGTAFDIVAISSPFAPILQSHLGTWSFTYDHFMGMPTWLPFMYGNSSLIVIQGYELLNKRLKNRKIS